MSVHTDLVADCTADALFGVQGDSITFTPSGGPSRTITAIITETNAPRSYEKQHLTQTRKIEVIVRRSATLGIDAVGRGDVVNWAGERWSNPEVVQGHATVQTIRFERPQIEATGRGRPGGL